MGNICELFRSRLIPDPSIDFVSVPMKRFSSLPILATGILVASTLQLHAQAPAAPAEAPAAATPAPKPPKPPRTPESAVTPSIKDKGRHDQFLERIKKGPIGLLFLGDSITDNFPGHAKPVWAKYESYQVADFGIGGDRTEHVLWRITNGELDGIDPKVLVLMIGTNNIGHFNDEKPEWAATGVTKIVETIREKLPKTKILLLGVFPRDGANSPHRAGVNAINQIIAKLDNGKTIRYLDIGKKFLDANGEIPKDIMPDSLHPNEKGYEIWHDAMQPLLDEMWK